MKIDNVGNAHVFVVLCSINIILAIIWCSCWCVFVEEQEDICLSTWWSDCSICFFWAARVPFDYLGVPHFYSGPCNHVLMVQRVHLYQQVSVVTYIFISYDYTCLVLFIDGQVWKQVSSSHPRSSTSRRCVPSDCCWFEDWNQSRPCYVAKCCIWQRDQEFLGCTFLLLI